MPGLKFLRRMGDIPMEQSLIKPLRRALVSSSFTECRRGAIEARGASVNCKACNTRLAQGQKLCPNCGHADSAVPFIDSPAAASGSEEAQQLAPSNLGAFVEGADTDLFSGGEIEFEEVEMAIRETQSSEKAQPAARSGEKKSKPGRKKERASQSKASAEGARRSNRGPVSVVIPVDPEQVRHLIVERPEVLEANLSVHVDEDGNEVGARFETDVGEIDLLGRTDAGDWVLAMVVSGPSEQGNAIGGMIQRIGWVRKHLAESSQAVRGVVLTGWADEDLAYAAAALTDSVRFLGWRLSLGFESLVP